MHNSSSHLETFVGAKLLGGEGAVFSDVSGTLVLATRPMINTGWSGRLKSPYRVPAGEYRLVLPNGRTGTIRVAEPGDSPRFHGIGTLEVDLFEQLRSLGRLPTPPEAVLVFAELARAEDTSHAEVAETILADPALEPRILTFSRSLHVNLREVSSVQEAIGRLGSRPVAMLGLALSLLSMQRREVCPSFDHGRFWSRALACAVAANALSQHSTITFSEEAFLAGLVSRIGQLVLAAAIPDEYEEVLQLVTNFGGDLATAERDAIGTVHQTVGGRLLEQWRLPRTICRAVGRYGELGQGKRAHGVPPLAHLLHLADQVAEVVCEAPMRCAATIDRLSETVQDFAAIGHRRWPAVFDQISAHWRQLGSILHLPTVQVKSFPELESEARIVLDQWSDPEPQARADFQ